jgi:hypothetical protein
LIVTRTPQCDARPLVDDATDTLTPRLSRRAPHFHVILRRCSQGLSVRWLSLRTEEQRPPIPMGKMHMPASLWRTYWEPMLRARADRGLFQFTVDDQAGA